MKTKFSHRILPSLKFIVTLAVLITIADADEFREFTNQDGRSIRARAVSFPPGTSVVKLELENGNLFEVPIISLSLDDQGYLARQKKRIEATAHPRGWKKITVHLPGIDDQILAPGIFGAFYRIGVRSWSGEIPPGMWLRLESKQTGPWSSTPQLLYRFDGEGSDFRFSFSEGIFRVSIDGSAPHAVGAVAPTLDEENVSDNDLLEAKHELQNAVFLEAVKEKSESGSFCLQPALPFDRRAAGKLHRLFDGVVLFDIPMDEFFASRTLSEMEIGAIRLPEYGRLVDFASPSPSLEFISIEQPAGEELPPQPKLKIVEFGSANTSQLNSLGKSSGLEFVTVRTSSDPRAKHSLAYWNTLKNIKGIDFPKDSWGIEPATVARFELLETTFFQSWDMNPHGFWLEHLDHVRNIFFSASLDSSAITRFTKSRKMNNGLQLRLVENENPVSFSTMPNLQALILRNFRRERPITIVLENELTVTPTGDFPYIWPLRDLESLEYLEFLRIGGLTQETLNQLADLPNPESLKTLILNGLVNCYDLSVLERFTNLRVLGLYDIELVGGETRFATELDLTALEKLEALESNAQLDFKTGNLMHQNIGSESPFIFQTE